MYCYLLSFVTMYCAERSDLILHPSTQTISDAMLHDLQLKSETELSIHELACLRYNREEQSVTSVAFSLNCSHQFHDSGLAEES
jgi:hypothetical protein